MTTNCSSASEHAGVIADQFTRQAAVFAAAPALHDKDALDLLVNAARPLASHRSLDVACGPGSVVLAFAKRVAHAAGLDATPAMLDQARVASERAGITNVEWHSGDVYALPFEASFDIVSCRFAFHHLLDPLRALAEMVRVARPGGRIVLCDAVASDDPGKAASFNAMERFRDPSTIEFRPLSALVHMFAGVGLTPPEVCFYHVPVERERLVAASFPAGDDRTALSAMLDAAVDGDTMGVGARRVGDTVRFAYRTVVLVSTKGA